MLYPRNTFVVLPPYAHEVRVASTSELNQKPTGFGSEGSWLAHKDSRWADGAHTRTR